MIDNENTKAVPVLAKRPQDETTKIIRKVDKTPAQKNKFLDAAPRVKQEQYSASIER